MFSGVEVNKDIDHKFRLLIPEELVRTKKIGEFVYLVNVKVRGRLLTRIYYEKPKISKALEIEVDRTSGCHRVTVIKSIREASFSFYYGKHIKIVDRGKCLELLPWPSTQ